MSTISLKAPRFERVQDLEMFREIIQRTASDKAVTKVAEALVAYDNQACPGVITAAEFSNFSSAIQKYALERGTNGNSANYEFGDDFKAIYSPAAKLEGARYAEISARGLATVDSFVEKCPSGK